MEIFFNMELNDLRIISCSKSNPKFLLKEFHVVTYTVLHAHLSVNIVIELLPQHLRIHIDFKVT